MNEKVISVYRDNKSQALIARPFGKFKDYGALVGIYPMIEKSKHVDVNELGEALVSLFEKCISTGYSIKEHEQYLKDHLDIGSKNIKDRYFKKKLSTSEQAKKFLQVDISRRSGQKSYLVSLMKYDSGYRSMVRDKEVRVKITDGSEAIGQAVLDLMKLD